MVATTCCRGHSCGARRCSASANHGLNDFAVEYQESVVHHFDGIPLHVLPLERVIASNQATQRPKDLAAPEKAESTGRTRSCEGSP